MDSSLLPSLIWIIMAIVGLAVWRTNPLMARHAVMGAAGVGISLLQRGWTLVGGGLLGFGVVLLVASLWTDSRGPDPSFKHPVTLLGGSTLVMLAIVGVVFPYIDDVRVKTALVVVMVVVGAVFVLIHNRVHAPIGEKGAARTNPVTA